jgi:RNA polymerase sigma factor (sigma-70 family)
VTSANGDPESAPAEPEPTRLVERARAGDAAALRELLCRHQGPLRAYVRLHVDPFLRARESCSDMVQSTFRECLQDAGTFVFQSEPAFRKWLFQKALSKIVDRRRYWLADKRDPGDRMAVPVETVPIQAASASGIAIRGEDLATLEACFEQLPEDYRRVITAARLLGQPHAEIAAEMARSVDAVGMLLNRALARLARLMRDRERGESSRDTVRTTR